VNAKPHAHEVDVRREYNASWEGKWHITYGDTRVVMWNWGHFNKEKALKRKIAKAIRKHDKGSVAAGKLFGSRESTQEWVWENYNTKWCKPQPWHHEYDPGMRAVVATKEEVWASEVMANVGVD